MSRELNHFNPIANGLPFVFSLLTLTLTLAHLLAAPTIGNRRTTVGAP